MKSKGKINVRVANYETILGNNQVKATILEWVHTRTGKNIGDYFGRKPARAEQKTNQ